MKNPYDVLNDIFIDMANIGVFRIYCHADEILILLSDSSWRVLYTNNEFIKDEFLRLKKDLERG